MKQTQQYITANPCYFVTEYTGQLKTIPLHTQTLT